MESLEDNLLQACKDGDFNRALQLIQQGCNPKSVREKDYLWSFSVFDNSGYTPLHYACKKGGDLGFVKTLVETYSCDPQCKSRWGETPLHVACWSGRLDIVKYLITEQNCNPQCADRWGQTPLHKACCEGGLDIVKYLTTEGNCNPQCTDDSGRTPLHKACHEGGLDIVKYLTTEGNCNPQCTDDSGRTPLHKACQEGRLDIAKYLITEQNCNPRCTDTLGQTPLHWACRSGRLDLVKYLITEQNCNPQRTDKWGRTPLHWACRVGKKDIVRYLLREVHCDPNHATQRTFRNTVFEYEPAQPLGMTSDPGIIRELIECGANPEKIMGELPKNCPKQSTELAVKVFVVGEKGAGKSTLTKAMSLQKGVLAYMVNWFTKVSGVDANTAGIIPHDIQSERFGHIILYDFAGHKEFYASHSAMLRNAAVGSTAAIILLVVDLRESDEKIIRSIQSWLHLLLTACRMHVSSGLNSRVIVVGSRADEQKENIPRKRNNVTALFPMAVVNFVGFVAVDCRYATSSSMSELCQHLSESCRTVRNQARTDFSCHFFFLYLLQTYHGSPAVSVRTIVTDFQKSQSKTLTQYVPELHDLAQIKTFCEEMNEKGNVLLLRNEATFEESWVILNKGALLSQVTGTIFAPKDSGFKEYRDIANTTGVVPFSKLEGVFPNLDPKMLVQFLCHLEFCHEITDPEGLQLIQEAARSSTTPNERWFFFPGLVRINAPDRVWETDDKLVYQSGWLLECSQSHQFFTPHFLQVLLLRLAFSFALAPDISHDHPAFQRKCSVWKNGIYWSNHDGVECLVEIEDRQVSVMLRCPKGVDHELGCWHLRSLVVRKVLDALESNMSTNEIVLHPSDVTYPLNQVVRHFSIQGIARAIPKTKPSAVSTNGRTATLEDLLHFEPYAQLDQHILQELFGEHNPEIITDDFLRHFANRVRRNDSKYVALFEHLITEIYDRNGRKHPRLPSDLVQVMQVWRDHSEGTFQCLRRELDQFSVFAGRNPLELAGYASKRTTVSGDSAAINSDETAPSSEWSLEKIDDTPLDIEVLHDVNVAVVTVVDWRDLGLALGLSPDTLKCITDMYPRDPRRCLTEVLAEWLQKEGTSWRALVAALREPTVGKEGLSNEIAETHGVDGCQSDSSDIPSYQDVDNTPLDTRSDSLLQVKQEVLTIHNWFHLGLSLKLSYHTLRRIEKQDPQDILHCLTEMLLAWLAGRDLATPSWQALVCALSSPIVNKREVANTIATSHLKPN